MGCDCEKSSGHYVATIWTPHPFEENVQKHPFWPFRGSAVNSKRIVLVCFSEEEEKGVWSSLGQRPIFFRQINMT